jgi:hypothetical protein
MLGKLKPIDLAGNDYDINDIDLAVRSRWNRKDKDLEIAGLDKKFIGEKEGFRIYEVDNEWIKNNLDVSFGTGGHGLVHSYIPLDEIWVSPVVEKKWSIALHEITEFKLMKEKEMKYKKAHRKTIDVTQGIVNKKEIKTNELLGRV